MQLDDLPTPCLVLDRAILLRNLASMRTAIERHGVRLRPHLKTAKSIDVARLAFGGATGPITVSTLAEAEYFAGHGFDDITLAAGVTAQKLERAAALRRRGVQITLITDDVATARIIGAHPAGVRALVEVDSGEGRGGVAPDGTALLDVATALGPAMAGALTHAGHSYGGRTVEAIRATAEEERQAITSAADRLRLAGLPIATVSMGSTPTATHAARLDGVTEVRAGVYMFADLFQAEIASCTRDDIALTVLASVIGRRDDGRILLDAGALALSKDRSTERTAHDAGFGIVWDMAGMPRFGECRIERVYQEHGVTAAGHPLPLDELPVGAKVRVAPNHACLTAAAHDRYHVVDGGTEVVAVWDRINGW